jgi:hypothetical protein
VATFLFWNIAKRPLDQEVTTLCDELAVDVLAVAECAISAAKMLTTLNSGVLKGFSAIADPASGSKIKWFTRLPIANIERVVDGGGLSLVEVKLFDCSPILVGAVHLPSKLNEGPLEQAETARVTAALIREMEIARSVEDTLIFGDFNMNPFDEGMAAVNGFNAVMDRRIAKRDKISYKGNQYRCFYNPMWSLLGDESAGPPGTFWFPRRLVRYHWNCYDQAIFRSTLMSRIGRSDVVVISESNGLVFAGSGKKWRCPSDHLPILVKIREVA